MKFIMFFSIFLLIICLLPSVEITEERRLMPCEDISENGYVKLISKDGLTCYAGIYEIRYSPLFNTAFKHNHGLSIYDGMVFGFKILTGKDITVQPIRVNEGEYYTLFLLVGESTEGKKVKP